VRRPTPIDLSGALVHIGEREHWLLVVRDLSDRKWIGAFLRHEHQFLKQLHTTTRLIESETGFKTFLEDTLRSVLALLDMDAGLIASPAWGQSSLETLRPDDCVLTGEGGLGADLCRALVTQHARETHASPESGEEREVRMAAGDALSSAERAEGLRTRVVADLASRYGRYGLLALWRRGAEPIHERDTTLVRSIASHLSLAIENAALFASVSRAENDWHRTFDAVDDAVLVLDAKGRVTRVNRSAAEQLGRPADDVVGLDAGELLFQGDAAKDVARLDFVPRSSASRRSIEGRVPGLGRGTFELSAASLFGSAGEYRGAAVVARDVTAERRAQQQLVISEKMSTIGRMAAGVTHEINNPAAFVLLNVSHLGERVHALEQLFDEYGAALLAHGGQEALRRLKEREETLGISNLVSELSSLASESLEGMQRIRDITQELRLFSRVRDSEPQNFDLGAVLDSAVAITRHQVRHRGRLVREPSVLPQVRGDPARMTQVFVNLIVNAAQALPEGHAEEHLVALRAFVEGSRVCVEVRDTGQGIASGDLPHIFEPFFTTKDPGVGTGLGLALCYEIVQRHGGLIDVESELGRGSTFRVWLPTAAGPSIEPAPRAARESKTQEPARILFVEDEAGLRRAVRRVLREHALEFASSGREAIELLGRDRDFDVIVCDVVMPDVSGVEVFDWLRRSAPELTERFAFMTGGVRRDVDLPAVRSSGRPVLEKPVEAVALRNLIEQLRPK
jgi:PAS domain S-box-containing protein